MKGESSFIFFGGLVLASLFWPVKESDGWLFFHALQLIRYGAPFGIAAFSWVALEKLDDIQRRLTRLEEQHRPGRESW